MKAGLVVVLTLIMIAGADAGTTQTRKALVIGNDSYPGNALKNARNDATAVAKALNSLGYSTSLFLDTNEKELARAIDQFSESINAGDLAVLYYAGHGFQLAGENYLVPTDFVVSTPEEAKRTAYSLSALLERLTSHGAATQIIILDACRDNPFLGSRSMRGGWAGFGTSAGTFLAFGTSPGSTASDDPTQPHGLFTMDLLKYLTSSPLDIEGMFRQVRLDVIRDSKGQQIPWTASSLVGSLHMQPSLDEGGVAIPPLAPVAVGQQARLVASRKITATVVAGRSAQTDSDAYAGMAPNTASANAGTLSAGLDRLASNLLSAPSGTAQEGRIARVLGLIYQREGRLDLAEQLLNRAIADDTTSPDGYLERCIIRSLQNVDAALQDCRTAVERAPRSPDAHLALSSVLLAADQTSTAYSEANRSIELDPQNGLGFALRGRIAAKLGYRSLAHQDYQRAARLSGSPGNGDH